MTDHNALAPRSNPSPTGDRAARAYLSRCFDSALSTMLRAHTACTNRAAVLSTMAGAGACSRCNALSRSKASR